MGKAGVFYQRARIAGGATMSDIALAVESRREICGRCEHRHDFEIADIDLFLCKLRYRSTCSMKAALMNQASTCPHEDEVWRTTWNLAATETMGGCGEPGAIPPMTRDQWAEARKQRGNQPIPHDRRGITKAIKVYQ